MNIVSTVNVKWKCVYEYSFGKMNSHVLQVGVCMQLGLFAFEVADEHLYF